MKNNNIKTIGIIMIFSLVFLSASSLSLLAYGGAMNYSNPFTNFKLQNNGTLSTQLDSLGQMLCKMNMERGYAVNGPCLGQ